ncbi:hypothetical protein ACQ4PT_053483 [Festuca glaucescens]
MAERSKSSAMVIAQVWSDWEIQLYVLLSFVLQIFLFFVGSLRRRSGHKALVRFPIWLAYLLADLVAVYALGYLSRHVATTTMNRDERRHELTFFWAPFLLIHLGGQDSVTGFSIEDNELWLRHLLNLLAQVWLALYVFWQSTPGDRLVVPAAFVFLAGIIKYGERTWALKSGSESALRSSGASNEAAVKQVVRIGAEADLQYSEISRCALCWATGVRDVFAGRKLHQIDSQASEKLTNNVAFEGLEDGEVHFKIVEIELGLMYDELYTKAKVVQTLPGAFCLEVCAVFSVMMSPRAWAFLEGRRCHTLARVVCARLQARQWWSNSMGQYNFLSSCIPGKTGLCSTLLTKIMGLLGAKQLWSNILHSKHAEVNKGLKDTISTFLGELQPESRVPFHAPPTSLSSCPSFREIIRNDFTQALLFLHVFTDLFLHKVGTPVITEETRGLMEVCKGMSDYMFYLLAVHPAMLPVGSNVQDLVAEAMESVKASSAASSKEQFLSALADGSETDAFQLTSKLFQEAQGVLLQQGQDLGAALKEVVSMWVPLLVYAAGKSSSKEHARRLSMGGDLLTFVWMLMAHRMLGDIGSVSGGAKIFIMAWRRRCYPDGQEVHGGAPISFDVFIMEKEVEEDNDRTIY